MTPIRILAPAKVNLGLAILGKRPDGYHDIDTIMAMIDLSDEITVMPRSDGGVFISGMDEVPVETNLMTKAARMWSEAAGTDANWHIEIEKRIPSPAGIGGGSSDAAAVLSALNTMHGYPLCESTMHQLATEIGVDCPFFLSGPGARATGTGTDLRPLIVPNGWVVLAIPRMSDTAKTTMLYGELTPDDYANSIEIDVIEQRIARGKMVGGGLINSFLRPALQTFPSLPRLKHQMEAVAGSASLSGSGPALYAVAETEHHAITWADKLRLQAAGATAIFIAGFLQSSPKPELVP